MDCGSCMVKDLFNTGYLSTRSPISFGKNIRIYSAATVGGKTEKEGPLGEFIDIYCEDEKLGQKTWENAESEMCRMALDTAMAKGKISQKNVDYLIAGDLMNQCTGAAYGLSGFDIPYFGLYGACSTFAESIIIGSLMIEAGAAQCVAAVVSSHFCTAERQYRFPLEYGSFSESTAQNTVTGAGCVILCEAGAGESGAFVTGAVPGIVCDRGIQDAANMGAAMCTAAADTILRYFEKTSEKPSDFDLISTGDLGKEGKDIALEILEKKLLGIADVYNDCGVMIYDTEKQDVGCGGSGCGCSALVGAGYIYSSILNGNIKKCLLLGTGAMMSPQSLLQGQSIPAVAHLIKLEGR